VVFALSRQINKQKYENN